MTGEEFKAAIKNAGYNQATFAELMKVHRQTIGAQCQASVVDPYWAYAIAGVVAIKSAASVMAIAKSIEQIKVEANPTTNQAVKHMPNKVESEHDDK